MMLGPNIGTLTAHHQGDVHPGQRWQSHSRQILRPKHLSRRQGAEDVRADAVQQVTPLQRRDHYAGRPDFRIQEQRGPVFLRGGQHARERVDTGVGAELLVRFGQHDLEEERGEASGTGQSGHYHAGFR